jgi:hypothetical protein
MGKEVKTMQKTGLKPYTSPELVTHGPMVRLTRFAGSGAVDGIVGIDVDRDGDNDTVAGNGEKPIGNGS